MAKPAQCGMGDYRSYGWDENQQTLLEPCECGTRVACYECGRPHLYIGRCKACGARGLPTMDERADALNGPQAEP